MHRKILNLAFFHIILAIAMSACLSLAHADTVLVDNESDFFALANAVEYYEEGSESLTIDDVLAANFAVNFIPRRQTL